MRVQLRDLNPPRGSAWRYGRGRGRAFDPSRHSVHTAEVASRETSSENSNGKSVHSEHHSDVVPPVPEGNGDSDTFKYPTLLDQPADESNVEVVSSSPEEEAHTQTPEPTLVEYPRSQPSPNSSYTREAPSHHHGHKWGSEPASAPPTPSHSSYASSVSATAPSVPYPLQNMGYYHPQPWMPPHFAQQMPYGMSFVPGYPGYPPPPQQMSQPFPSPPGSDCSASTGPQPTWTPSGPVYHVCLPLIFLILG